LNYQFLLPLQNYLISLCICFLAYVRTKYPAAVDRLVKASMAEKLQEFRDVNANLSQKIDLEPACDDIDDHDDSA
jgi:hypothetical protein